MVRDIAANMNEIKPYESHDTSQGLYSAEVQGLLQSVFPSDDPLQQPNFNVVDYINKLFPTEQSLSNIDDVVTGVENDIRDLDEEIRLAVHSQTHAVTEGREALEDAQDAIQQLFVMIKSIRDRAEQSEQSVKEITRDIKQLDTAKKNLTSSITTLNHLHMLIGGVETLNTLSQKRCYSQVANLLQGVKNVMEHLEKFKHIPVVKDLSGKLYEVESCLKKQIFDDFDNAFSKKSTARQNIDMDLLKDACHIADSLGGNVRKEIIKKFIKSQLAEYIVLFESTQDCAWLDKIDQRYSWIKRALSEFEERYSRVFPQNWEVCEFIAVEFCSITFKELVSIMRRREKEIDVRLLLFAIQRTSNFETLLGKRLTGATFKNTMSEEIVGIPEDIDHSNPFYEEVKKEAQQKPENNADASNPFTGLISNCFESYLHIYIKSQDQNLAELITKFQQDFQLSQSNKNTESSAGMQSEVLPTCADLFVYYKKCLVQCSQLSTGEPMVSLARLFQKYLQEYAVKLLSNNLPKLSVSQTSNASVTSGLSFSSVTNLIKETTSQLKDSGSESNKLTSHDISLACSILSTADYCLETTQQLHEKLRQKVDKNLENKINLMPECETFSSVVANSIQLLVFDLIGSCEPAFYAMSKVSWATMQQVGDQSSYVSAIAGHMKQTVPQIRDNLSSVRKYFTQFCLKFANSFIPRYVSALHKCKPLSTVGTEQLLLDTHSLKTLLLEMPSVGSHVGRKAPASFTKIVVKGMTKVEMILKVSMYPHHNEEAFVDNYLSLFSASEADIYQKVLEMKGLKRSEQTVLLDLFWRKQPVHAADSTQGNMQSAAKKSDSHMSDSALKIKKLEKLIRKKL